ncbi:hypothetical protein [Alkalicoccobacillus murimartini]|uniref:Nitric oxide reductase large subunit n=1 Tax=Alkalicoccobacillus murimartini TaxID=171685 RepID=A0ABT9YHB8_9BACI|nr:hypothetical protein [Alkalicoccobacillus murimartini]MDQ0207258.1 nitric oxide reductase large subunit [Alkalicoccobacillus murimartini]
MKMFSKLFILSVVLFSVVTFHSQTAFAESDPEPEPIYTPSGKVNLEK